jgi:hypothetical protein
MAQVCFEMIKAGSGGGGTTPNAAMFGQDYIQRDHVHGFVERVIHKNEQLVHSFYAKTEFDPRVPIRKGK